jgi:hypothetical protein
MTEEQFRNERIKIIIHYAYLVVGYNDVHDVLEKTLSAPFDIWSSLDKTVKTSLVGKAFQLFSLLLWQCALIGDDFQLWGTFEYTCHREMTSGCNRNFSKV